MNVIFAILSYAIARAVSFGAIVQPGRRKKTAEANVRPIAGEQLIEQLDEIVMILDDDDRVVDVNQAAQRLIGRPTEEIVGQTTRSLFPENIDLIQRFSGIKE